MIKYSYKIIRDEADEKRVYIPKIIPEQIPNVACVEGPNSSGKSTLLHIMGLAFYGDKEKSIKPILRKKMNDLLDTSHQKLSFKIGIEDERNHLGLFSEKNLNSQDISVYEIINGKKKRLVKETFNRKYRLIYDIPDNPMERLKEVLNKLRDQQQMLGNRFSKMSSYIRDILEQISESRDPKKIAHFEDKISELEGEFKEMIERRDSLERDKIALSKYCYAKYCIDYEEKCKETKRDIRNIKGKSKVKKLKKDTWKKNEEEFVKEAHTKIKKMKSAIAEAAILLEELLSSENKQYLHQWMKVRLEEALLEPEDDMIFADGIEHFIKSIKSRIDDIGEERKIDECNFYKDILETLEHYRGIKAVIPGLEKTIPEFIRIIETKYKEYENIQIRYANLNECQKKLEEIEDMRFDFITNYTPKYRMLVEGLKREKEVDIGIENMEDDINDLKEKLKSIEAKHDFYRTQCIKMGLNEKKLNPVIEEFGRISGLAAYQGFTEKQLNRKISEMEKEVEQCGNQIRDKDRRITNLKEDLERMKRQKEHKYQAHNDRLKDLFKKTQKLQQIFLYEYGEYLVHLIGGNLPKKINDSQKTYYKHVGDYLGKMLTPFTHIDEEYVVVSVDFIKGNIHTQKGKIIKLNELGTGQSQSNFLKTILKNVGEKKLILLIDEIAMMDKKSLTPIYNKLGELFRNGSLIAGIVVQKADSVNIYSIASKSKK